MAPPTIQISFVPKYGTTPLEVVKSEIPPGAEDAIEVHCDGVHVGTIERSVWAAHEGPLRWTDVQPLSATATPTAPTANDLFASLRHTYPRHTHPQYYASPFKHGTDRSEDLTMLGPEVFTILFQAYNHWFGQRDNSVRIERVVQSMEGLDTAEFTSAELGYLESKLRTAWKRVHNALLRRPSALRAPSGAVIRTHATLCNNKKRPRTD